MSFLLKDSIHRILAESVYNDLLSRRSNYYYCIGKVLDWDDPDSPDTPLATDEYEYDVRRSIISAKKLQVTDVSFVTRRIDWTPSVVYDQFDGGYSSSYPADSGATKLKNANFYVLTTDFHVYKCLYNNEGAPSTQMPNSTDLTPVTYSDGYIWKYLYTIPLSLRNRFLTTAYMPVLKAVNNAFYSNGEISSVVIDNPGSGYSGNAYTTLTVNGTFLGKPGNSIANLSPVFNDSGQIINVIIRAQGNNYSNATIVVNDALGSGNSYYNGVANVQTYNVGTGYTTAVRNNTTIALTTTGALLPTANAVLTPVYGNNSTLVSISVVNPGAGYTTAVKNNTTLSITTTGASQPTANASANVYYNTTAVLTPVLRNGKLDRVLINDPGVNYSANNQTTISYIGDGSNAVLTPYINEAGQLADVIIENRGQGYTYIDINVNGNGSNANAYAVLSAGDLDSSQGFVELSAIDGGIYAFRVLNAGTGYTTANISVLGDGVNFLGNVVLNPNNNTITKITVTNPGSGYRFGNVIIGGNGSNANVQAIISPFGGHGKNPITELFADTLMFYSTINNEQNQGVSVNNDYRQISILKDVKQNGNQRAFISNFGSTCYLVTLNSVTGLARDSVLSLTDISGGRRQFEVVEVIASTKQVLITDKDNYSLTEGTILNDSSTNTNYTIITVDESPEINKFSGDLVFIDNRTTVSYSDQQLVTLRTVIQL